MKVSNQCPACGAHQLYDLGSTEGDASLDEHGRALCLDCTRSQDLSAATARTHPAPGTPTPKPKPKHLAAWDWDGLRALIND